MFMLLLLKWGMCISVIVPDQWKAMCCKCIIIKQSHIVPGHLITGIAPNVIISTFSTLLVPWLLTYCEQSLYLLD